MNELFGVIAPHPPIMVQAVGGSKAAVTRASADAMREIAQALAAFEPDSVVVISPHAPSFSDAFAIDGSPRLVGAMLQFGDATNYSYQGDPELAHELIAELESRGIEAFDRVDVPRARPGELDHAVLVPLSFLDPDGRWPLVVVSLSGLGYAAHRELGDALRVVAQRLGRRVAFVASGDCSHRLSSDGPYGFSPAGPQLDAAMRQLIERGDFEGLALIEEDIVEEGGECGLRSFIAMGGFLPDGPTRVLAYEGPWGVGYLTAVVGAEAIALLGVAPVGDKGGQAGDDESEIVRLARATIETYLRDGVILDAPRLDDPNLPARAGAFVSLHREECLRGCIGTILPTRATLAEEVVHNAIEAATRDPRFPCMTEAELDDLDIKVDVLHAPEPIESEVDLDPTVFGVIVSSGWRRGLLLPDLEGVDDVATQVAIARQKAGILPGEPVRLERFRVDRYS
jgi:AmmeMemoRadiSam system protein A